MRPKRVFALVLLVFSAHGSARAQSPTVIGEVVRQALEGAELKPRFNACQKGRPAPLADFVKAKQSAGQLMQAYVRLAHAADTVDATSLFTVQNNPRLWFDLAGKRGTPDAISDPIARQFDPSMPVPPPTSLALAGDRRSIMGTWTLTSASQEVLGSYAVTFRKNAHHWVLSRLELIPREVLPVLARPYCNLPGDIEAAAEATARMHLKDATKH